MGAPENTLLNMVADMCDQLYKHAYMLFRSFSLRLRALQDAK